MGEYIYKVSGEKKTIGGLKIHVAKFLGKPSYFNLNVDMDKHPYGFIIRGVKDIEATYVVFHEFDENEPNEVGLMPAGSNVISDYERRFDAIVIVGHVSKVNGKWEFTPKASEVA
jgi:hypothetical protein